MTARELGRQPAFPLQAQASPGSEIAWGLTKREYFAGLALQGLLANADREAENEGFAQVAVSLADALLFKLSREAA